MELAVENFAVHPEEGDLPSRHPNWRRPVDLVHLARYTLGDRTFERQILELFCTQSRVYLKRLKDAPIGGKLWKAAAHTIKLSASDIGAWRLANIAETAEALEGDTLTMTRDEIVEALEVHISETDWFIRTLLSEAHH